MSDSERKRERERETEREREEKKPKILIWGIYATKRSHTIYFSIDGLKDFRQLKTVENLCWNSEFKEW